jgi:diguanylate cyclase (GGDEF)-like protein/PAS domain S-box-containing protein
MFHILKSALREDTPTVLSSADLRTASKVIWGSGRGFVVILEGEVPVGILTERDLSKAIAQNISLDTPVQEVMTKNLITLRWDRPLHYGLEVMLENNIRRLVLVSEEGKFVGVVSMEDLIRLMDKSALVRELKIKDIVLKNPPITAPHTMTTRESARLMWEERIGCLPVLKDEKLYGIITERDIARLTAEGLLDEPLERTATRPVITVSPEDTLAYASNLMEERKIRHLVVVEGERVMGVISHRDIARLLGEGYTRHIEEKLRHAKAILELFPECVIEALDYGDYQMVVWENKKVKEKMGSLIDRRLDEIFPERDWIYVYYKLKKEGKVAVFRGIEGKGIFKDGRYYELSASYLPLEDQRAKGRIKLIVRDITEELEKQQGSIRQLNVLQKVINSTDEMIIIYSAETGKLKIWNNSVKTKLGYTDSELETKTIFDINLLDPEVLAENIQKIVRQGLVIRGRRLYKTAFGKTLPVDISATHLLLNGENYVLVVARDISYEQKLEEELKDKVRKLETMHQFILNLNRCTSEGEAYNLLAHTLRTQVGVDLVVVYKVNPSLNRVQDKLIYGKGEYSACMEEEPLYCKVFNSPQPFVVQDHSSYSCPFFRSEFGSYMCILVVSSGRTISILSLISYEENFFSSDRVSYIQDLIHTFSPFVSNLRLIEINRELSTKDPLTGLYNRRFAMEFLTKELEKAKRYKKHLSLVMVDLDDFKKINDTYGHAVGDMCLKTFANTLLKHLRSADIAVRWGGEEFLLVLPETPKDVCKDIVHRLRDALKMEGMTVGLECVLLTASWGVASYPEDGEDLEELLKIADDRCYIAKKSGKDRVVGD